MGTVASLDADGELSGEAVSQLEAVFARVDARFSLYRADTELSRVARGEVPLDEASAELRAVYAEALAWRGLTDGAFTAHRPDGVIDLSGIVKARAIAEAAALLDTPAPGAWRFGVGGDLSWSAAEPGPFGIVDPADREALLTAVRPGPGRRALATSGSAERGDHIWTRYQPAASPYRQVSVMADDIVTADVLATAIVAGGEQTLDLVGDHWDVDVLTVDRGGELRATPGMRAAIRGAADRVA